MERNIKNTDDIKKFFKFTGKINKEYSSVLKGVGFIFILTTVFASSVIRRQGADILGVMYVSLYMSVYFLKQYLYTGVYEAGSVSARLQNIYAVIRYAPFDESAMRKEKFRMLAVFLLKVTAAGSVIQLIKFLAERENYNPADLAAMAFILFVWPFAVGAAYIFINEKSLTGRNMMNSEKTKK